MRSETVYEEIKAAAADVPDMSGDVTAFGHGLGVGPTVVRRALNRLVREGVLVRDGRADGDNTIYSVKR